jgi:hypothetical protein
MAQTFPLPSSPGKPPAGPGPVYKPFPGEVPAGPKYAKGGAVQAAHYAEGGAVLGRTRDFMKEASPFRSSTDGVAPANQRPIEAGGTPGEPTNSYPKKGKGEQGRDKSLKTVMPRS